MLGPKLEDLPPVPIKHLDNDFIISYDIIYSQINVYLKNHPGRGVSGQSLLITKFKYYGFS